MKNEKERNEYNDLLEKYQLLLVQKSTNDNFNNEEIIGSQKNLKNSDKENRMVDVKKKLPTINAYEVESIGTEIKYGLLLKRIPFSEIEQVFNKKKHKNIIKFYCSICLLLKQFLRKKLPSQKCKQF